MLQRANVREIFWAEVKARIVPFLRGFPAVSQVGRGGDAGGDKEAAASLPQPSRSPGI